MPNLIPNNPVIFSALLLKLINNQTIMMSLAMVVIASLVSAPGLGTLVLDGINNLRLGVGFVAGFGIVVLAVILDRISKTALARIDESRDI